MNISFSRRLIAVVLVLFLASLACIINTKTPTPGSHNPPNAIGDQNLSNPAAGLDSLKSYQAALTVSFSGKQNGQDSNWSTTYTLSVEPAVGTRLLQVTSTGLSDQDLLDGWVSGSYAGLLIERAGNSGPCLVQKNDGAPLDMKLEPASLLPAVTGAVASGSETILGMDADHSTFGQSAVGLPAKGTVSGDMWQAADGGVLLKYHLSAQGGPDLFGQEMQGALTWDYQLSNVNETIHVDLPENCPPGLIDAPVMDDAEVLAEQPALQEYNVNSDVKGVISFFQEKLPPLGYTLQGEPTSGEAAEPLTYTKPGWELDILMEKVSDSSTHVLVALQHTSEAAAGPTATPEATSTANPEVDLAKRLGQAMSLLSVTKDKPSPLGSFHLEVIESTPGTDKASGKVHVSQVKIKADVEGTNYYLQHIQDGKTINDGYMISGQEYDLKNGKVSQGFGLIDVDWASWSLDILMPYSIASLGPTPAGQESVDSRTADVYTLDSANANPLALSTLQSMNPFSNMVIDSATGKVWIDQQTGAMLKLTLQYTAEVKDAQGKTLATENGQIDLVVTKVGAVSVKLP